MKTQRVEMRLTLISQISSVVDPDPYTDWIRIQWGP
jgi:hypothetical protein